MKWIKYNVGAKRAIYNEETGLKEYVPINIEAEQQWSEEAENALKDKIISVYDDGATETYNERLERIETAVAAIKDFYERFVGGKLNV